MPATAKEWWFAVRIFNVLGVNRTLLRYDIAEDALKCQGIIVSKCPNRIKIIKDEESESRWNEDG